MKEFELKTVVPPSIAESEHIFRTELLTEEAITEIDDKAQGNYYREVPKEYKRFIDAMVMEKAKEAGDVFDESLHNEIARTWLIRQAVVPKLMAEEGFQDIQQMHYEPHNGEFQRSEFACITSKGSVLMLGQGGLLPSELGTAIGWEPLPEVANENNPQLHFDQGARVMGKPEVGKRLEVRYSKVRDDVRLRDFVDNTAPIVAVFKGSKGSSLDALQQRITASDAYVRVRKQK